MSDIDELKSLGCRWFAVHTYNGYEDKVKTALDNILKNRADLAEYIFDSRVPTVMEIESDGEKMVEKKVKLLPSYILVRMIMTDESWHIVRNITGVTGFVGPGSRPEPLDDGEVEQLLGADAQQVAKDIVYKEGDVVQVLDGPFRGFSGKITEVHTDTNEITISIATPGGDIPATVGVKDVSPETH